MRLSAVQHGWSPHQQRQQSEKPPHPEKQPRIATSPRSRHVNASARRFLHDQDPKQCSMERGFRDQDDHRSSEANVSF